MNNYAIQLGLFWLYALLGVACTQAQIISGPIQNPANGHSYYLTGQSTWTAAEATAVSLGSHLATINDQAENDWVFSTFSQFGGESRNLWIGLAGVGTYDSFHWVSGETAGYRNFAAGEPNGSDPFVYIIAPGISASSGWNNCPDLDSMEYIGGGYLPFLPIHGVIEVVPEPSSLALCGLAALALLRRRR